MESSFIPIDDVIFEHRMYLPLVGCSIFVSAVLFRIIRNKKIHRCVCGAVILSLCFLTLWRCVSPKGGGLQCASKMMQKRAMSLKQDRDLLELPVVFSLFELV